MRLASALVAAIAVLALAACKYPEPPDQCDGYCAIFAIDRPLARPGDTITLEGNLDKAMRVAFPGDTEQPALATYGPHRATVVVPANATAGLLGARGNSNYTESVAFRATSFELELQPFRTTYEQTEGGRFLGARAGFARSGASVAAAGDRIYLVGGTGPGGLENTIDVAIAGPDGSLTEPSRTTATLSSPRAHHSTVVLGSFVYAIGGQVAAGTTDTVDGANLETGNVLLPFGSLPIRLTVPRESLATVVIGNYVYAIGGKNADGEVDYIERAQIGDNGELGNFEPIFEIKLRVPRSGHTVAVVGDSLYVIGGFANGAPVAETERFTIFPDAYLADEAESAGNLATPRGHHTSIVLGDSIYVIGGSGGTGALASIEKATIGDSLSWQTVDTHELSAARSASMLIQAGNHVFVVGGTDATGKQLDTFERASIIGHSAASPNHVVVEDFKATDIALLQPRDYASTLVVGHTLYVIGGGVQSGPTKSIETATINADGTLSAFTAAPVALNQARMAHASFVYDNYYYVAGGRTSVDTLGYTSSVERAHIEPDGTLGSFQQIAFTLDAPRGYHGAIVAGRRLYIIGGLTTGAVFLDTVFTTPLTGTTFAAMTQDSVLPGDRARFSMFVLPTDAFLFAGRETATAHSAGLQSSLTGDALSPWFAISANPSGRDGTVLVSAGDTVYAFGGVGLGALAGTERMTVQRDNTLGRFDASPVGALVAPRYGHSAVTLGDHVFVLGGGDNTPTLFGSAEISTIR